MSREIAQIIVSKTQKNTLFFQEGSEGRLTRVACRPDGCTPPWVHFEAEASISIPLQSLTTPLLFPYCFLSLSTFPSAPCPLPIRSLLSSWRQVSLSFPPSPSLCPCLPILLSLHLCPSSSCSCDVINIYLYATRGGGRCVEGGLSGF